MSNLCKASSRVSLRLKSQAILLSRQQYSIAHCRLGYFCMPPKKLPNCPLFSGTGQQYRALKHVLF